MRDRKRGGEVCATESAVERSALLRRPGQRKLSGGVNRAGILTISYNYYQLRSAHPNQHSCVTAIIFSSAAEHYCEVLIIDSSEGRKSVKRKFMI